jgi:hypothetical protein
MGFDPPPNQNIYLEQLRNARQAERQPDNDHDPTRPPRYSSQRALLAALIAVALVVLILFVMSVLRK